MTTPERDKVEGLVDDAKGRGKMAAGDLTGNERLKAEGFQNRATGAVKRVASDVKSRLDDVINAVTKRVKGS